ncbi:MAG: hypothetical protein KF687_16750 [Cyclobacteriaceae bacterium]|nr:hypothetical protein [Cyclobacteriaceae bacterium]
MRISIGLFVLLLVVESFGHVKNNHKTDSLNLLLSAYIHYRVWDYRKEWK